MKTKRVNRYYCDHCGKGRCAKHHAIQHEARCIRNPLRNCGFCIIAKLPVTPMPELIKAVKEEGLEALRSAANCCPGCMLAAIVQSKVNEGLRDEDGYADGVQFDYKKEVAEWWSGHNDCARSHETVCW